MAPSKSAGHSTVTSNLTPTGRLCSDAINKPPLLMSTVLPAPPPLDLFRTA
ncbi:MAG TPA: hypothetical protein VNV82_02740 [Bryobacteraceae bacterium]|nr:hypothetical protein [Bryobacteraceae bacterium]